VSELPGRIPSTASSTSTLPATRTLGPISQRSPGGTVKLPEIAVSLTTRSHSLGGGITGGSRTSSTTEPETSPTVATMVTRPGATPVAKPDASTVATRAESDRHATAYSRSTPDESTTLAVNWTLSPGSTEGPEPGETATPAAVVSSGGTGTESHAQGRRTVSRTVTVMRTVSGGGAGRVSVTRSVSRTTTVVGGGSGIAR
jgi:hypothetical protein